MLLGPIARIAGSLTVQILYLVVWISQKKLWQDLVYNYFIWEQEEGSRGAQYRGGGKTNMGCIIEVVVRFSGISISKKVSE